LIHKASNGQSTYAMITNGGTDTLNGVPGLTFSGTLSLKFNNGVNTAAAGIPTPVKTAGGDVSLNFRNLGAHRMSIEGTANLDIGGFFTLNNAGFVIQKTTVGTTTKIIIAVSVPTAYIGSSSLGVQLNDIKLGVVIYRDAAGAGSTYALVASIGSVAI